MQKYIKIFLITSIILLFINFSCNEESPVNQSPYEETQLIGYSSGDSCLIHLRQYGDSAEVEIEVDSFDIYITHKNAMFNCCLDSIEVELVEARDTFKLYEIEVLFDDMACSCTCPYEINATIGVSASGIYLIEIFEGDRLVYQEWVEVP